MHLHKIESAFNAKWPTQRRAHYAFKIKGMCGMWEEVGRVVNSNIVIKQVHIGVPASQKGMFEVNKLDIERATGLSFTYD